MADPLDVLGQDESLFVDNLSADEIAAIERRMRDPNFCRTGFLPAGESLITRVRADAATLRELGITHNQIADRLEIIIREAQRLKQLRHETIIREEADARARTPEHKRRMRVLMHRLSLLLLRMKLLVPPPIRRKLLEKIVKDLSGTARGERPCFIVDGCFSVTMFHYAGYQYCPFSYDRERGSCGAASSDIVIRNTRDGSSIAFPELLIHMVRDHQFFEGEGIPYRLDPRRAAVTLELVSGPEPE